MDLMDLLQKSGGESSVGKLAGTLGLDQSDAQKLIGSLSPAIVASLQKQVTSESGMSALHKALAKGGHQAYIDKPELLESEDTRRDGNKILGHLFGSKDVSRNVAAQAANETGIDAGLIKKALPLVAGLAMGALSKKSEPAAPTGGSGLGDLLGALSGGGSGGVGVDDILGLAKKFF